MTPTELLMVSLYGENFRLTVSGDVLNKFQKAFEAENIEKTRNTLYKGKVADKIGFENALELWIETINDVK